MSVLRALVWDVDGTLAETEEDGHRPAFNQAFADAGLPWQWDAATYADLLSTTGGKERMQRWWRQVDPVAASAPDAAERITRLQARKTALYVARVRQGGVVLRPGVQRLLTEARTAGLTLAIATTTSPENVQALLVATLGADSPGWFSVIGAGDAVPAKKPAPDIYRWVLDRLGLPAHACLAIEDSGPGARAAQAAGLPVLVTRSRYSQADAMPPLLADLDGLGSHGAAARGVVLGQPWQGVASVPLLQQWFAALARQGCGPSGSTGTGLPAV